MANNSINLVNLDFASFKTQLKTYLKSQDIFKDYDFEGSNMSVLLDILSYNTYTNSFYLNMIGNEMFMDTAVLRDSVVSHAKMLNYVPRSFKSARAIVDLTVYGGNTSVTSIIAPKGTSFTSRVGSNNFVFVTDQNVILTGTNGTYSAENVDIYEGDYVSESFVVNYANTTQRYILNSTNIDTDSITIASIEDNGGNTIHYTLATSLLDKASNSQIYFIQAAQNEKYEIIFGDGISGRKPKDNAVVLCEYRVTNGEIPNGAFKFISDGAIGGLSNVQIGTVAAAIGGSVNESIESVKFNAPRYFTAQERAITTEDYENLLKINFPEVLAVSAYGGQDVDPPQYGRVFVAVDIDQVDGLPASKRDEYYSFLKTRCPVSIEPIIIEPEMTFVYISSLVRYNINTTDLSAGDIKSFVLSAISTYSTTYLNDFNKTLRYSQLVTAIDNANENIVGNETDIEAVKKIRPLLNSNTPIVLDFNFALESGVTSGKLRHNNRSTSPIFSTSFDFQNQVARLQDDGLGSLNIVKADVGASIEKLAPAGTVDYTTGRLNITGLNIQSYYGSSIKIYVRPLLKDIFSTKNSILQIVADDVEIAIEQVRI
jgi:hypothetical protein